MQRTAVLRVVHDVGLAAWFGGALMGAVGMNAATLEVDDHTQRTRVANAGWFRWAPVAGLSILAHLGSAMELGRIHGPIGAEPRRLVGLRTAVTGLAALVTFQTAVWGRQVVRAGDVPVATAVRPIAATPDRVKQAQRRLRTGQWLVPAFSGVLWLLDALQDD